MCSTRRSSRDASRARVSRPTRSTPAWSRPTSGAGCLGRRGARGAPAILPEGGGTSQRLGGAGGCELLGGAAGLVAQARARRLFGRAGDARDVRKDEARLFGRREFDRDVRGFAFRHGVKE